MIGFIMVLIIGVVILVVSVLGLIKECRRKADA